MANDLNDTTIADYINEIKKEIASNRAVKENKNPTIRYLLDSTDSISLTDAVTIDGTTTTCSDNIALTDSDSRTDQATGTFVIRTTLIYFFFF